MKEQKTIGYCIINSNDQRAIYGYNSYYIIYTKRNINHKSKGIAIKLSKICNLDEKIDICYCD